MLGQVRLLTVKEVTGIGAFVGWGLEKTCFFHLKSRQ